MKIESRFNFHGNFDTVASEGSMCQYEESAHVRTGDGETFGQCLTTLRAEDWRRLLDFGGGDDDDLGAGMEEWLERMVREVGLDRNFT